MKFRRMRIFAMIGLFIWGLFSFQENPCHAKTEQIRDGFLYESPYVDFHIYKGEYYWTIKEPVPYSEPYYRYLERGMRPDFWYKWGTTYTTGLHSSIPALQKGQHYYQYEREGIVPIGKWAVSWEQGRCIHGQAITEYGGRSHGKDFCNYAYYSGWLAYCADCGESVTPVLVYASKDAVRSIAYMDTKGLYYYDCPTCGHLENAGCAETHVCKAVSWNQYKVVYNNNASSYLGCRISGYMEPSLHMYNNERNYRGGLVTPHTSLSYNHFVNEGYTFTGWNTKADGSGVTYKDGSAILNLSQYDWQEDGKKGIVTLYAQWKRTESTLVIDPNGGTYDGRSAPLYVKKVYNARYEVDPDKVQGTDSYRVSFETQGGTFITPLTAKVEFAGFQMLEPFQGTFSDNIYRFKAENQWVDTLRATFKPQSISLPTPSKAGKYFAGWYEDMEWKRLVGYGGDTYTPNKDVTLYAKWSDLVLWSTDNYTANGGRGAVDLRWAQRDSEGKLYKIYIAEEAGDFEQVYSEDDTVQANVVEQQFTFRGKSETYAVPYSGLYTLTANGAAGSDSSAYHGGKGGFATGKFHLERGELLTITCGGSNGYNGGGKGSSSLNGGGATTVESSLQGLLLCAGGGGAAGLNGNGGGGGENTSLRGDQEREGQAGYSGGGGGYVGGTAGTNITHYHSPDDPICNYHEHTEACYGKRLCGGTKQLVVLLTYGYWDDNGDGYCDQCMPNRISRAEHNYNHHQWAYRCTACGKQHSPTYSSYDSQPCDNEVGSSLTCVRKTYDCAYKEGAILSAKPAYGGSSFVDGRRAIYYSMVPNLQSGNGSVCIRGEELGLLSDKTLAGVKAPDREPPCAITKSSVLVVAVSDKEVEVQFEAPTDRGTNYRFQVESYSLADSDLLCISNITANTLTSGIKGYLYLVDEHTTSEVTLQNASNREHIQNITKTICEISDVEQYLHLAAIDVAGNVGPTTHIRLPKSDEDLPIRPDQMQVSAMIERMLEPHEPVFMAGESGILKIELQGSMDRLEVDFSREFQILNPELQWKFFYTDSVPEREQIVFMIPLRTQLTGQFMVRVRAFKGHRYVECYPVFTMKEGGMSVLSDLRTRLR